MRAEVNSAKRIYLIKTFQHKYIWRYVYFNCLCYAYEALNDLPSRCPLWSVVCCPFHPRPLSLGEVAYHDYHGILVDEEENVLIQKNLGPTSKVPYTHRLKDCRSWCWTSGLYGFIMCKSVHWNHRCEKHHLCIYRKWWMCPKLIIQI